MARILIVDDSPMDAKLIDGLLRASDEEFDTCHALDGEQAVAMVHQELPDLVLTDLVMPRLDGLGLVKRLAQEKPSTPVVITTSRGTEELAVQALEQGADGYIPKGRLNIDLVEVVCRVLAAAEHERLGHEVMKGLTVQSCKFDLPSDHALFRPLIQHLQDQLKLIGFAEESVRMRMGLALEEAISNAHVHGNLEVDSAIRETDFDAYLRTINERMEQSPFRERRIRLEWCITREEATFVIDDDGAGYDPGSLPDPTAPENLERAAGRGLLLIRTFMDNVDVVQPGNRLVMKLRANGNHKVETTP